MVYRTARKQFMTQNFSSLVPRKKLFFTKRNMQALVDPDELVRTVTVAYSCCQICLARIGWSTRGSRRRY